MKLLVILCTTLLTLNTSAIEKIVCKSTKAFQQSVSELQSDVDLEFKIIKNGNKSEIQSIVGHIFVKSQFEKNEPGFSTEDSYMGFFKIDSLKANPNYNPNKYKGYAQFKDFDATHTAGLEDGMWGYLTLDVSQNDSKNADMVGAYVFQSGDHMGGTILLNCQSR